MLPVFKRLKHKLGLHSVVIAILCMPVYANQSRIDYLSLAQGAIPVSSNETAKLLKVGTDRALLTIDGNRQGFSLTPKPGRADTSITLVFQLPALTTFTEFAIPNVLETPSPSQTFIKTVQIAGSDQGPEGPFRVLASTQLKTHETQNQLTTFPVNEKKQVRWIQLTLSGGINIQREKSFFDFSEIIGYGHQQPVPMLNTFTGKWKGRGVIMELKQQGINVNGCYDREGELAGTVDGNLLRATGKSNKTGVPSSFVLTIMDDGRITGVRSTNGAPFKLYTANTKANLTTHCSQQQVTSPGCDSIIHGIHFDFDSATIRKDSYKMLELLYNGLKHSNASSITVIGHTSSEGSDAYNESLSQRRATSVVAALVNKGIQPAKLSADGRGEKEPIADNTTDAGRSLNRRVEIQCR